ncbi:MAG TPA: GNAT family N-acetyltransferase [Saprospiraceae bacterium]|nr:GNAT family N-acetyltransferase [Saprospiraceae bacterium]HMQ83811.1 GNAT family N-acetyltransferase [Saprospiraceae bacterium]
MKVICTTSRLLLREWTAEADFQWFYELNEDPLVVQYTGDAPFVSKEAAYQFLSQYDQYEQYGMGRWAVALKDQPDTVLGWCGLKYHPDSDQVDVGYRFFRRYWGNGYATEAAKASIDYGFYHLGLPTIYAHAMKNNIASIKVLEKIGMSYWKNSIMEGQEAVLYKIER